MAQHNDFGRWGEDLAEQYLIDHDYAIVERDWHSGHRDIDIIAVKDYTYVFVEVKTRRNTDFGDPIESIDYKKRNNLRAAIAHYLHTHDNILESRVDVISIVAPTPYDVKIEHIEDISLL